MKDKHTINLILISSKWVIPSFGVCCWWINSSPSVLHLFFPEFKFPRSSRRNLHLNHRKAHLILSSFNFISSSFLLPEFFMVVLHDLFHSSRVHQDFVGAVQISVLLASRSAINSPYSFEVEFCISSSFSAIQSFSLWSEITS